MSTAIERAERIGREHGRNAGEWFAQDAIVRTVGTKNARRILAGIDDGDPAIVDTFPAPDLSGQWADEWSGLDLAEFVGADDDEFGDVCNAYEIAFMEAVWSAIADACRSVLA